MKVVVAGGTGFIGQALCLALSSRGDEVVALTRYPEGRSGSKVSSWPGVKALEWSAKPAKREAWWHEVDGADAVVNLAGEPVIGPRWSDEHKASVLASRLDAAAAVRDAMEAASVRPAVCVNASAVGYYGLNATSPVDESAGPGDDFLATVCRQWEEATEPMSALGVRVVNLRIGIVLGERGGALSKMTTPFKLGVGGPLGSGKQWMPWVHLDDVVGLTLFAIGTSQVAGPLNAVSPGGVENAEFSRALGRAMHRPALIKTPAFAIKLALGEAADVVLGGQHAVPKKALDAGYVFQWPDVEPALENVV